MRLYLTLKALNLNESMISRTLSCIAVLVCIAFTSIQAEEITIYSHRHYEADKALYTHFTEQTGVEVNLVRAGADELIERLKAEGDNSPADILITVDAGRLERAKSAGLLKSVESAILEERIPANYRDRDMQWFGVSTRARVFAYAPDRVDASELNNYEDLANPESHQSESEKSSIF